MAGTHRRLPAVPKRFPCWESVGRSKSARTARTGTAAKSAHRVKFGFKKVGLLFACLLLLAIAPRKQQRQESTLVLQSWLCCSAGSGTQTCTHFTTICSLIHILLPQTDIAELDGGKVAKISFPNPNDLSSFDVSVTPDSGYWKSATYHFTFQIPAHYPHSPPKVECNTRIYHPNIDLQGKVCLNILREDWKPVLDINSVIYGLIYLFYEPNPDDPLNHEAAELFRKDVRQFERLVTRTLRGGTLEGTKFDRLVDH